MSSYHKHIILLGLYVFIGIGTALSQIPNIPTGTWREHFSFINPKYCEATQKYVYASTENGFWRTDNFGQMNVLRRSDGFAGAEITCLRYSSEADVLFIGYIDGNIDLLFNDSKIERVPGFKNKLLQGDKRIEDVTFFGSDAVVSTQFGILVLDVSKKEIRDSYTSIGPGGSQVAIKGACVVADSIYVATEENIMCAPWNRSVNLNDFQQWTVCLEVSNARDLHAYRDSLFFVKDSSVIQYSQGNQLVSYNDNRPITDLFSNEQGVHLAGPGRITRINGANPATLSVNLITQATQDMKGNYWFCTGYNTGVIRKTDAGEMSFYPTGPANRSVFAMTQNGSTLLVSGGGVSATFGNGFNTSGYYLYNQTGWKSNLSSPLSQNLYDFTFVARNPKNNKYYAATHSFGILEFTGKDISDRIDEKNSPLEKINDSLFMHIGGMKFDQNGGLWLVNRNKEKALLHREPSGNWHSIQMPNNDVIGLEIDDQNRKWFIMQSGGIYVFHEGDDINAKFDDQWKFLNQSNGLVSNQVLSIRCDKNGYVWIGTNQGLNIFSGSDVFRDPKLDRFIVEQDGSVGYLMGEEYIRDILIDGGNRKWFATTNGVFCIDEYGQRVIRHFTTDNSPLLSNRVVCLGQVDYSSELFIGTDFGIISYQNDAGVGNDDFQKIKVYPNPVPPKFTGEITIDGLAEDSEIRITDIQGKMVYQTTSNGSKATWNGLRLNGTKPNSGVYLIFAINRDGSQTAMGKFIFIR
ncbi:T9SS type A sorting domain-containing protein [Bacteroidia bacterium]|nr:T9SS type A sorting domain-containing protein [Bacteroidia bacterium]